jgi:glycerophosphoryl diester phosphodiesterase
MTLVTEQLVARYHRLGLEVHVWTINDEATMRRVLAMGVDGIVTDRADIALGVVDS